MLDFVTSGAAPDPAADDIRRLLRKKFPGRPVSVDRAALTVCCSHLPDVAAVRRSLAVAGYPAVRVWFGGAPVPGAGH